MNGNRWKKAAGILCLCALLAGLTGCAKKEPLSLTVWTYYNGEQLGAFNEAVEAFSATVGRDKNIVVSASSLGSVNDLEQNVMDAVRGKVGAQEVRVGYEYIVKTSEFELTGIITAMTVAE